MMKPAGRLVIAAVAIPVAAKALRRASQSMRARHGNSPTANALNRAASGAESLSGRRRGW